MKIYLLEDIPKTGKKGTVVEVSEGFGRYLVKQNQASGVSADVVRRLEKTREQEQHKSQEELEKIQEMAAKLDGGEVEIEPPTKNGAFYAALSAKEIVKAIKDQLGVTIKADQLKIKKPIKEVGEYDIAITFKHGLEAEVKIIVS